MIVVMILRNVRICNFILNIFNNDGNFHKLQLQLDLDVITEMGDRRVVQVQINVGKVKETVIMMMTALAI